MDSKSPLADFHGSHGASLAEYDGRLLPKDFGDVEAEYRAVRSTVGLIDLSCRGLLQVTGPDRLSFLQGMLSNDLRFLKPFQGHLATLLNQQGKVLADVRVLCAMNSFYLDFWLGLKDKIVAHLNRYLVADEVEITDRSEAYATLSLQGPRSEALLKEWAGQGEIPEARWHHTMVNTNGADICIVRASHTGEIGFDLIIPTAELVKTAQRLTEIGMRFSAGWVGRQAQEILRVEAGIAQYGIDFNEDTLFLETGLDTHVSFHKGCYLGQEIVERVRSRGHVNKKLSGLLIEGASPARPGGAIQKDEKQVGTITSSVYSPQLNQAIALGYIHRDHWGAGTPLTVPGHAGTLKALVADLPFINNS